MNAVEKNIFNQLPSYCRWVQHSLLTDSTLLQKAICEVKPANTTSCVSYSVFIFFISTIMSMQKLEVEYLLKKR